MAQTKLESFSKNIVLIIFLGSLIAFVLGGFVGAPTMPSAWISTIFMSIFFLSFGIVPLFIIAAIFMAIAKSRKRVMSNILIWGPGLLFIPLSFGSGWFLGDAFEMPGRGEAGSEYVPLAVGIMWFYAGIAASGLSIFMGLIDNLRTKSASK